MVLFLKSVIFLMLILHSDGSLIVYVILVCGSFKLVPIAS